MSTRSWPSKSEVRSTLISVGQVDLYQSPEESLMLVEIRTDPSQP